jgi:deoxyribodipyrimidine photolyase
MPSKASKARTASARILPIVGALTVFLTYMIHDVLRDNLKDKAEALSHAREQYQFMLMNTINVENQIYLAQAIDTDTRQKQDSMGNPAFLEATVAKVDAELQEMGWAPLIKEMPNAKNLYQPQLDKIVELKETLENMLNKRAADDKAGKRSEVSDSDLKKARDELKLKVESVHTSIVWDASKALEFAEQEYSFYNNFSIALYVIGWGLGFLGIILGFGEPAGSE